MLRYLTAGESHGPCLMGILEGMPAGLRVSREDLDRDLARRQRGYGRGGRMAIEQDRAEILAGVRLGVTTGAPIGLLIRNRDWENWAAIMGADDTGTDGGGADQPDRRVTRPRPGHADLAGALKYGHTDIRNVLERASARETAMRVAVGALARRLLAELGVGVHSHVVRIGGVTARADGLEPAAIAAAAEESPVRCADPGAGLRMMNEIDRAREAGDTLGGVVEVLVTGLPPGLGSHVHWDRRLDGRLAGAAMSVPAIKGVEIGLGFEAAARPGSEVHDAIYRDRGRGLYRRTNRAGGLEGGMTNGETLTLRAAMKPIATLLAPLESVDLATGEPAAAAVERSDICAVPAAGVVLEAVVALVLAESVIEKFGGDSLEELLGNIRNYLSVVAARQGRP